MLKEFIELLELEVKNHSIYVWGAQGQTKPTITEAWIKKCAKTTSTGNSAVAYWKKQVEAGFGEMLKAFDCSGLGIYSLQKLGIIKVDMNANGLKGKCTILSKAELKKGDWVFKTYKTGTKKGKAYHIGYVVDDALNVIEARGSAYGVVKRPLSQGGWNTYGRPTYFKDEIEATAAVIFNRVLKKLSPQMEGEDIRLLQKTLNKLGYSCGAEDGIFGSKTEAGVLAFQKAKKIKVDGKAGKQTITTMGYKWEG